MKTLKIEVYIIIIIMFEEMERMDIIVNGCGLGTETFNAEQKAFVEMVLNRKGTFKVVLDAKGGTGKTFIIRHLYSMLRGKKYVVRILAPTHKAKSLFLKHKLKAETIHSFFKSIRNIDDSGNILFKLNTFSGKKKKTIIIVDECSMITAEMFAEFNKINNTIIFMGDRCQINPVNEDISPVFELETYTLSQNMRIKEKSDDIVTKFRKEVQGHGENILINKISKKELADLFNGDKDAVLLSWTNKSVDGWNKYIRKTLFGEDLSDFYAGEILVFSGYRSTDTATYFSSDMITIRSVSKCKLHISFGRKKDTISFFKLIDEEKTEWLYPVSSEKNKLEELLEENRKACGRKKSPADWGNYIAKKDTLLPDLKYSYCMTTHKAQGSEWDIVIVDIDDIKQNPNKEEANRLLYTAVSRFKKQLYFI
jgi:hypothetical protein